MSKKDYQNWSHERLLHEYKELLNRKKFGLVWEDKKEDVAEKCKDFLPVLKEEKKKEVLTSKNDTNHILIEGDNYHSLSVLCYTHKKKVDIIYIDPPYNKGGKDFVYNDNYVDKDDTFKHSKWLSFISKRLSLAKRYLLKDDGVIFISIGEEELSTLKLLADSIFGEKNFLSYITRVAKTASNKGNYFAPSTDFILVYAKNIEMLPQFKDEVNISLYKKEDENGMYRDDIALYQSSLDPMRGCVNQRYFIKCPDGSLVIPPGNILPKSKKDSAFIKPKTAEDKIWRWTYDTYLNNKELLVFKKTKRSPLLDENGNQAKYNIYTKSYLNDREKQGVLPRNYLDQFINRKGADFLKTLDINFDYPKPVELIKYLIKITNKEKDITILDFMAGSGTTGQAVLEMNFKDRGKRTFILCTNNELNGIGSALAKKGKKEDKEKFGICQRATLPRLERCIKGYASSDKKHFKSLGGNLKYFKTSFVANVKTDNDKRIFTNQSTEMLCLAEKTFDKIINKKEQFALYQNKEQITGIIYDEDYITDFKKEIEKFKKSIVAYVFSYDHTYSEEDFADIKKLVKVKPIPEVILNVYRKIYKDLYKTKRV